MVRIMSFTHFNNKKQASTTLKFRTEDVFICLTLRQWSLLFSFVMFICTAIFTVSGFLGIMHIKEVWHLVEDDIREEHEKNEFTLEGNVRQMSPNEEKLHASENFMRTASTFLTICTWGGFINLVLIVTMIYGIATRKHNYILPWLISSVIASLITASFITLACIGFVRYVSISEPILLWSLPIVLVYIYMWHLIFKYYLSIHPRYTVPRPNLPKTIRSLGMYTHTIQPKLGKEAIKKPMV